MIAVVIITAILVALFAWFRFVINIRRKNQRLITVKRYLVNAYMLAMPDGELKRIHGMPPEKYKDVYAWIENQACEPIQRLGIHHVERMMIETYQNVRRHLALGTW